MNIHKAFLQGFSEKTKCVSCVQRSHSFVASGCSFYEYADGVKKEVMVPLQQMEVGKRKLMRRFSQNQMEKSLFECECQRNVFRGEQYFFCRTSFVSLWAKHKKKN